MMMLNWDFNRDVKLKSVFSGEFLIAELSKFERFAHFEYVPLPGGEVSIKEPWRMAVSYLYHKWNFNVYKIMPNSVIKI